MIDHEWWKTKRQVEENEREENRIDKVVGVGESRVIVVFVD